MKCEKQQMYKLIQGVASYAIIEVDSMCANRKSLK